MVAVARIRTRPECACPLCFMVQDVAHRGTVATTVEYKHPLPVELTVETRTAEPSPNYTWTWADGRTDQISTFNSGSTLTTKMIGIDPKEHPLASREHYVPVWI